MDVCKVAAYVCKPLMRNGIVTHQQRHLLAHPTTIILDIVEEGTITLHIFNIYHLWPKRGHGLHHLLAHDLDELVPTLLLRDFNTHAHRWSMPDCMPSSWAQALTDWMDANNLSILNPLREPTWQSIWGMDCLSVLDLAVVNDTAFIGTQLSEVEISFEEPLRSDHAALSLTIYPLHSLALLPPPAPTGYIYNEDARPAWVKEFNRALPIVYAVTNLLMGDPTVSKKELAIQGHDTLKHWQSLDSRLGLD
jgi:hypothetical protein